MSTIAVWFSCGAASAVAAKKTIEMYPNDNVIVLNSGLIEEDSDNRRFLSDVEQWLGKKIEVISFMSARDIWWKRKFMSSPYGAPCTLEAKKNPRYEYEKKVKIDWHVLGFTSEEKHRFEAFKKSERENVINVLGNLGINKQNCADILTKAGIRLPEVYKHLPNANCIGCVKATSPTYWNKIREVWPLVFEDRANQSRQLGVKLVRYKGQRIFLDELPKEAKGRNMKNLSFDCGVFCAPELPFKGKTLKNIMTKPKK